MAASFCHMAMSEPEAGGRVGGAQRSRPALSEWRTIQTERGPQRQTSASSMFENDHGKVSCTRCYAGAVTGDARKSGRVFRTAWFIKAARKAHSSDEELGSAIRRLMRGQGDDLGGGVFKERLRKNQYRSIILARAGHYWVYEYLFAKQHRANIAEDELADFRRPVKAYAKLTTSQVNQLIPENDWMEICHGNQT